MGLPILSKLSACSSGLFRWGYHRVHDFKAQIKDCKDRMHQFRGKRDKASFNDFTVARDRYNELLHSHEVYWKQRSKAFWLRDGDSNSKLFHAMASTRRQTNNLAKFRNQEGQWCTKPEDVNALICEYFTTLFNAGHCSYDDVINCVESKIIDALICEYFTTLFNAEHCSYDDVINCVEFKIIDAQNQSLLEPFTAEDV